jgi:hypothetical protein
MAHLALLVVRVLGVHVLGCALQDLFKVRRYNYVCLCSIVDRCVVCGKFWGKEMGFSEMRMKYGIYEEV